MTLPLPVITLIRAQVRIQPGTPRRHEAFVVIMCMYLSLFVDFRVPTVMSLNRAIL